MNRSRRVDIFEVDDRSWWPGHRNSLFGSKRELMNVLQPPNAVFFIGLVVYFWIRHGFIKRTKTETRTVRRVDAIEKILLGMMLPAVLLLPLLYLFTPLISFADYRLPLFVRWSTWCHRISVSWVSHLMPRVDGCAVGSAEHEAN